MCIINQLTGFYAIFNIDDKRVKLIFSDTAFQIKKSANVKQQLKGDP